MNGDRKYTILDLEKFLRKRSDMIYTLCPVYLLLVYVLNKFFDAKYNFIPESNILIG